MEAKLVKKILTIIAIATLVLDIGILITAIFVPSIFEGGIVFKILLSSATLTVASTFAITAVGYMNKQPVISIINLCLLGLLSIFAFIIYWKGILFVDTFTRITLNLAILTILFCILVGVRVKLGKRFNVLQIFTYAAVIVAVILLSIIIWGVDVMAFIQIVVAEFLVAFALLATISILSRKSNAENINNNNGDMVTIPRLEYETLKAEVESLQKQLKELKGE